MRKKIISIALILALVLGSITTAFANEKTTALQNDPLLQTFVAYDMADVTFTSETDTSKTALVTFDNGVENNVTVTYEKDATNYEISQGALNDTVTITGDGEVFLNNKSIGSTNSLQVSPQVINQPFQQTSCPYGNASDYTYKAGSEQKANIALAKAVRDYTTLALATLVLYSAGPLLIAAMGGAGTAVSGAFFLKWIDDATDSAPDSKALSYKLTFYHHKNYTNGTVTPVMMYIRKNVITYYAKANYAGTSYQFIDYSGTIL